MPQLQDRQQLSSEELQEAPQTGPFAGVQTDMPPTEVPLVNGFITLQNFVTYHGGLWSRPGELNFAALPSGENYMGLARFYNINGQYNFVAWTRTHMYNVNAVAGWNTLIATLNGTFTQLYNYDVLNYKLCFTQGTDPLQYWDGIAAGPVVIAGAPPNPQLVAEIGTHLFVTSSQFPNRYYWSGIGDPTDWTGFTSGLNDVVNNFGPIAGICKIGQYGFGFHQLGIMQIIPTGIGTAPFAFYPICTSEVGLICPATLDTFNQDGQELAIYVGIDNVYIFNGSSSEPIGDRPIAGRRVGARTQIMQDIASSYLSLTSGKVTYSAYGFPQRTYWLNIPGVRTWIYNIDEGNWSTATWAQTPYYFQNYHFPFAPSSSAFEQVFVGFNGGVGNVLAVGSLCTQNQIITSGQLVFGDRRHEHTIKKFRLSFVDLQPTTFSITLISSTGQAQNFTLPMLGSGNGQVMNYVQEFNLTGLRFTYSVTALAPTTTQIVELAPMYTTGGEQRGGTIAN